MANKSDTRYDWPDRQPMRFRLRTLLFIVAAFSILLGLMSATLRRYGETYEVKKRVAQSVQDAGGRIMPETDDATPFWPLSAIGRHIYGSDVYQRIQDVDLSADDLTDGSQTPNVRGKFETALTNLADLSDVRNINIGCRHVDSNVFCLLCRIPRLDTLWLDSTDVSDKDLELLTGDVKLTYLDLSETGISDDGIKSLKNQTAIQHLSLGNTRISDRGIESLGMLPKLRELDLSGTRVTNASMKQLEALRLVVLDLRGTKVDSSGVALLANCDNLVDLRLDSTNVDDSVIATLQGLPKLWHLSIRGTNISEAGCAKLRKSVHWVDFGRDDVSYRNRAESRVSAPPATK